MRSDMHMPVRRTRRSGQSSSSPSPAPSPELRSELLDGLLEELQRRKVATQPRRDWILIVVSALPGLAAFGALIFTWLSISATTGATNNQLQIAEQGQVTDRYNAAITNLGSSSVDVRLGGIYALQRIMDDSPRDQPTVVAVLCAFVRDHTKGINPNGIFLQPKTDVQAALTVVGTRDTSHDGSTTVVDLSDAEITVVNLVGLDFSGATFVAADLNGANLDRANLAGANLLAVLLNSARLIHTNLTHANLSGVGLSLADLVDANCSNADLSGAVMAEANLSGANLSGADLANTDLSGANLSGANLSGAKLSGANLSGANLRGAKGLPTSISSATPAATR